MRFRKLAVAALGCLAALQAAAQCYTVYDRDNRPLYHSRESPVDMSQPLHETVQAMFPGGHLVFDNFSDCDSLRPLTPPVATATPAPDTARMGVGPAHRPQQEITELRDARVRVIREGDRLTIEPLESR